MMYVPAVLRSCSLHATTLRVVTFISVYEGGYPCAKLSIICSRCSQVSFIFQTMNGIISPVLVHVEERGGVGEWTLYIQLLYLKRM